MDLVELRCERRVDPAGVDVAAPLLGWKLRGAGAVARQTAYRVLVSGSREALAQDTGALWDSGRVSSDQSVDVPYGGVPLRAYQRCYWKVRVWDLEARESAWSAVAEWSMGILNAGEWGADWIGLDAGAELENPLEAARWIWFPETGEALDAPPGRRFFWLALELPEAALSSAEAVFAADTRFTLHLNGHEVLRSPAFNLGARADLLPHLKPGTNIFAVEAENAREEPGPAGLIGMVTIRLEDGSLLRLPTDATWRAGEEEAPGWRTADAAPAGWAHARELGAWGIEPWGAVGAPRGIPLPARMLRTTFEVAQPVQRATAHVCGLGLSETWVNGVKLGDHVLSPALSEYDKRAYYVTLDATEAVRQGANALGVWLGNGRFFAPRDATYHGMRSYGYPKLLLHLRIELADGSVQTITSAPDWKLSTDGPLRENNEFDGEVYDARLEMPGWSAPGFDDSAWAPVQRVDAPGGVLCAQPMAPIRVTQTITPRSVTRVAEGVHLVDFGQNLVGWCRLKVHGPRGTELTLRHGETLNAAGRLYTDNLRGAQARVAYTLRGGGEERYAPRFAYFGFRYVELTGFPGEPGLDAIEACVVHDDVRPAGSFTCSLPLLNQIYQNITWSVRGNYRSMPTDCPQRDERQGWLGDRHGESRGESYLFDVQALYNKWMDDVRDAQRESGSLPDVAPSYYPFYTDNMSWPGAYVIIPGTLHELYGDLRVIRRHYPGMKRWMAYMARYLEGDLLTRDQYGDWCVPPESPELIHSKDPARQTAAPLIGTAYYVHLLERLARYAELLGEDVDIAGFQAQAARMRAAFTAQFWDADAGCYGNGAATAQVLPLHFGLAEARAEQAFASLVHTLEVKNRAHLATGLVGTQWLMRTLSDHGRADLALRIAQQTDYPSWGHMIEHGATTIWELWNGSTADPAMNSHNHVMLVGDLHIWFFEYLGGIRPAAPGFKRILLRPVPLAGVEQVSVTHESPHGAIHSAWRREGGEFHWDLSVPANTTAEVWLPGPPLSGHEAWEALAEAEGCPRFLALPGSYTVRARAVP